MNRQHEPRSLGRIALGACAAAAIVVSALIFGGIDVLADHYGAAADATAVQALDGKTPPAHVRAS